MDSADALHDDMNEALQRAADEFGVLAPRLRELRDLVLAGLLDAKDILRAARLWQGMVDLIQELRPSRRLEDIDSPLQELIEITFDVAKAEGVLDGSAEVEENRGRGARDLDGSPTAPEESAKQTEGGVSNVAAYDLVKSVAKTLGGRRHRKNWSKEERAAIRLLLYTGRTWQTVRRAARAPRRRAARRARPRRTSGSRDGPPPEPDHQSKRRERASIREVLR
jgi:hypothetical protein